MKSLTLRLDNHSPNTLSLKRLGDYLACLSNVIGRDEPVHLHSVASGSAVLRLEVDDARYPQIVADLSELANGHGPKRRLIAYEKLRKMLSDDRTSAALIDHFQSAIASMPWAESTDATIEIIKYESVQGELYQVGGKDELVPVRLAGANGETYLCEGNREVASQISRHLYCQVRVSGSSIWTRTDKDGWRLKKLRIESYKVLSESDLGAALSNLRVNHGVNWGDMDDPHAIASDLRRGFEARH
jgi:hypothetical protein